MYYWLCVILFISLVAASARDIQDHQFLGFEEGDELRKSGSCKDITLIFARGTFQPGLLGLLVGPQLCDALKRSYSGTVACQGVGPEYTADLASNLLPGGTSAAAISEAKELFEQAAFQCPHTSIVAGGYSQGAAVMHGSIPTLSDQIKDRIKGVVMFGDSRQQQSHNRIDHFSEQKVKFYCDEHDGICQNSISLSLSHYEYGSKAEDASQWLLSQVNSTNQNVG
ncbi:putative cutinase 2 [Aspergillus sergii]|uniref:Cutinase n=1 Tax=Aspergillus sergii TaxID=1034303 RepID=A0A5N6WT77_9EURO|nr:putative cutinase 2 [Aspergillus sergii]